jgi:hypothetical protein
MVLWLAHRTHSVQGSNLDQKSDFRDRALNDFPQSIHTNDEISP